MLTPKEKAEELFNKYYQYDITIIGTESKFEERVISLYDAKKLTIIAVDEILKSGCTLPSDNAYYGDNEEASKYWLEVKQEIEKL